MAIAVNQAGDYRGQIVWSALESKPSGAVAIHVMARVDAVWNPDTQKWEDWRAHDVEAEGYLYIIKKNGTPNDSQVKALGEYAGWDGDVLSVKEGTWKPIPCRFSVEENEYEGNVTYRISWLNDYDSQVGGNELSHDDAKKLQTQHGASMRALIGNAKRNAAAPTGTPQTPPTSESKQAPPLTSETAKAEAARAEAALNDGVPF